MTTDFVSWARLRRAVNPRIWFSSLYCDGRPVWLAESGIYLGEFTKWRRETGVQINDGTDNKRWGAIWDIYVLPIVNKTDSALDVIHAYQYAEAAAYFRPVKD